VKPFYRACASFQRVTGQPSRTCTTQMQKGALEE
jgi:hypothetical protein